MLSAPTMAGPDGMPVASGNDGTALVMSMLAEMQNGMQMLAQALNAPKQLIRDANGEVIGVAPMQPQGRMN
jgi:hypothetical protein